MSSDRGWEALATNLRVQGALLRAIAELEELPVVVFKGPLLTEQIHGDLRKRASADNDLYLPEPYASQALNRLLSLGYTPPAGIEPWHAFRSLGQVVLWPDGDADAVSLDLHVEPFNRRYFDVSAEFIEQHIVFRTVQGRPVRTFDPPLAFAHLIAHWVQHHFEEPLLADIAAAWKAWRADFAQSAEFRSVLLGSCGLEAYELAMLWCARLGHLEQLPGGDGHVRTRLVDRLLRSRAGQRAVLRKFCALFLVAPEKLLSSSYGALVLDEAALQARYGAGGRARLLIRHAVWTVRQAAVSQDRNARG